MTTPMYGYFYTLTTNRDFLPAEILAIAAWFRKTCESGLVVEERGANGKLHLHATTTQKQKTAGEISRRIQKLYEHLDIPWTKGVSVHVKRTTDQIGMFYYLTKDLHGKVPVMLFGWTMTWITQQCRDNVKKIPHKMIKGDDYILNMVIAPNLMIEYAKRSAIPLNGKEGFKEVVARMMAEGYQFQNIKFKLLYCEIMARCDDTRAIRSFLDNELQFLE